MRFSLEIKNAFNSVPWEGIWKGLEAEAVPIYLRAIIESFLSDRKVVFEKPDGTMACRRGRSLDRCCGTLSKMSFLRELHFLKIYRSRVRGRQASVGDGS